MQIIHCSQVFNKMEENLRSRTGVPKLPISSLPTLSKMIHGLPPGKMTVIGARTSMGKTAFAMQLMIDFITIGASVLYIGFEMQPEEMLERMFCNRYRISNLELARGSVVGLDKELGDFKKWQENLQLVFTDDFAKDWTELETFLEALPLGAKPDVVVVDFIQAIQHTNEHDKRFIDDYIRAFKMMSLRNDFAGIVVSQINRTSPEAKNKEPQLHQLKGSGFLEEHADMVFLLDWKDKTKPEFVINVAKNRSGPTGWINAHYISNQYRFEEPPPVSAEPKGKDRVDWNG